MAATTNSNATIKPRKIQPQLTLKSVHRERNSNTSISASTMTAAAMTAMVSHRCTRGTSVYPASYSRNITPFDRFFLRAGIPADTQTRYYTQTLPGKRLTSAKEACITGRMCGFIRKHPDRHRIRDYRHARWVHYQIRVTRSAMNGMSLIRGRPACADGTAWRRMRSASWEIALRSAKFLPAHGVLSLWLTHCLLLLVLTLALPPRHSWQYGGRVSKKCCAGSRCLSCGSPYSVLSRCGACVSLRTGGCCLAMCAFKRPHLLCAHVLPRARCRSRWTWRISSRILERRI